jgi:hypothetical protein
MPKGHISPHGPHLDADRDVVFSTPEIKTVLFPAMSQYNCAGTACFTGSFLHLQSVTPFGRMQAKSGAHWAANIAAPAGLKRRKPADPCTFCNIHSTHLKHLFQTLEIW